MNSFDPIFIDTNIFLRVAVRENEQLFKECKKLINEIKIGQLNAYTSDLVLAEIVWTLLTYYRASKTKVVATISAILNLNGLKVVSGYNYKKALKLYSHANVKHIDACIAAIDQVAEQNWTVVSYDSDFKKLPVKWRLP